MKDEFSKIHKAAIKFLVPLMPEETYKLIVEEAIKLVGADYGSILLEQGGDLFRVYAYPEILHKVKNRKRGFMYNVFNNRAPVILDIKDFATIHPLIARIKVRTSLGIPLSYRNTSIGVLSLQSTKRNFFTEKDVKILSLFASLATLAIRKTQLHDETKKALETRDQFIAMAAHELKTPITTINGYIQLLNSRLSKIGGTESRWIEELSGEISRLMLLVNELLAVDQIKAGQFKYFWKKCSLKDVIKRAIVGFNFTHPEYKIVFNELDKNYHTVVGDFDKLIQVITNLLDNAAKFSPHGSIITITLSYKKPSIILVVKDEGSGISNKDLPKIFDRFYRGQNHVREGMGLGLFLANNIIKEHNGKMLIRSKEQKGTSVTIKLPYIKDV